jgi:hypothetical protein
LHKSREFSQACLGGGSHFVNAMDHYKLAIITACIYSFGSRSGLAPRPFKAYRQASVYRNRRRNSLPNSFCHELLVVERWLGVINELRQDSYGSYESDSEGEQINCFVRESGKEGLNFKSSQHDGVLLMLGQSPNRRCTQSSSVLRGGHRQDQYQHRRAWCTRPAPS